MSVREARGGFTLRDTGLQRVVALFLVVIVALALQSILLVQLTILRVIPQLVLVVVVSLAYSDGERFGVVAGFLGGLMQDLQQPGLPVGLYALVYTLVGFGVGSFRQYVNSESVWMPVLAVMISSAVAEGSYAVLAIMLGERWISFQDTVVVAGLVVLYNTLLAPFVFPIVNRIAARYRPERVHRL